MLTSLGSSLKPWTQPDTCNVWPSDIREGLAESAITPDGTYKGIVRPILGAADATNGAAYDAGETCISCTVHQ